MTASIPRIQSDLNFFLQGNFNSRYVCPSPRHGAYWGWGLRRRPPGMDGTRKCIRLSGLGQCTGGGPQTWSWGEGANNSTSSKK
jgi:hypothetical protein